MMAGRRQSFYASEAGQETGHTTRGARRLRSEGREALETPLATSSVAMNLPTGTELAEIGRSVCDTTETMTDPNTDDGSSITIQRDSGGSLDRSGRSSVVQGMPGPLLPGESGGDGRIPDFRFGGPGGPGNYDILRAGVHVRTHTRTRAGAGEFRNAWTAWTGPGNTPDLSEIICKNQPLVVTDG